MSEWIIASERLPQIGQIVDVKILSFSTAKMTTESHFTIDDSKEMTSTVIAWKEKDVDNANSELQRAE